MTVLRRLYAWLEFLVLILAVLGCLLIVQFLPGPDE